ncbi:MAG: CRISPR system precrRNA processing endoribonuclease RAMP protein Cas6 [Clostridia bacterium]|nr:CRISPR system precrRNA processing endoribonuclease RAMP protein Cas6 [Clostridia bacterium]
MIVRAALRLKGREEPYGAALAYPLYAWLLSMIPHEEGDRMHEQGIRPVSQYVWHDHKAQEDWWIVNLLNDEAIALFLPVLEQVKEADLHRQTIRFGMRQIERIDSAQAFIQRAHALPEAKRYEFLFSAPTSFKQNGRYVIFPQEALILQSLVGHWNLCYPEVTLDDPDAMQAILRGVYITDYKLQTLRHSLKQTRIPSFIGKVVLDVRLPAPLAEVFRTLYCFAPYAGMGIKTALGMGGVQIASQQHSCDGMDSVNKENS